MVKLNLLPPEERTKKQVIKENFVAITLLVVLLAMLAGFNAYLFLLKMDADNRMTSADNDITLQKKINSKYKNIEDTVSSLNKNMILLQTLKSSNITWSALYTELKNKMPKDAVLTEITTTIEGEGTKNVGATTITIKGNSPVLLPIAELRESLSTSTLFDYVDLQSAIRGGQTSGDPFEFILQLKIKQQAKNGK